MTEVRFASPGEYIRVSCAFLEKTSTKKRVYPRSTEDYVLIYVNDQSIGDYTLFDIEKRTKNISIRIKDKYTNCVRCGIIYDPEKPSEFGACRWHTKQMVIPAPKIHPSLSNLDISMAEWMEKLSKLVDIALYAKVRPGVYPGSAVIIHHLLSQELDRTKAPTRKLVKVLIDKYPSIGTIINGNNPNGGALSKGVFEHGEWSCCKQASKAAIGCWIGNHSFINPFPDLYDTENSVRGTEHMSAVWMRLLSAEIESSYDLQKRLELEAEFNSFIGAFLLDMQNKDTGMYHPVIWVPDFRYTGQPSLSFDHRKKFSATSKTDEYPGNMIHWMKTKSLIELGDPEDAFYSPYVPDAPMRADPENLRIARERRVESILEEKIIAPRMPEEFDGDKTHFNRLIKRNFDAGPLIEQFESKWKTPVVEKAAERFLELRTKKIPILPFGGGYKSLLFEKYSLWLAELAMNPDRELEFPFVSEEEAPINYFSLQDACDQIRRELDYVATYITPGWALVSDIRNAPMRILPTLYRWKLPEIGILVSRWIMGRHGENAAKEYRVLNFHLSEAAITDFSRIGPYVQAKMRLMQKGKFSPMLNRPRFDRLVQAWEWLLARTRELLGDQIAVENLPVPVQAETSRSWLLLALLNLFYAPSFDQTQWVQFEIDLILEKSDFFEKLLDGDEEKSLSKIAENLYSKFDEQNMPRDFSIPSGRFPSGYEFSSFEFDPSVKRSIAAENFDRNNLGIDDQEVKFMMLKTVMTELATATGFKDSQNALDTLARMEIFVESLLSRKSLAGTENIILVPSRYKPADWLGLMSVVEYYSKSLHTRWLRTALEKTRYVPGYYLEAGELLPDLVLASKKVVSRLGGEEYYTEQEIYFLASNLNVYKEKLRLCIEAYGTENFTAEQSAFCAWILVEYPTLSKSEYQAMYQKFYSIARGDEAPMGDRLLEMARDFKDKVSMELKKQKAILDQLSYETDPEGVVFQRIVKSKHPVLGFKMLMVVRDIDKGESFLAYRALKEEISAKITATEPFFLSSSLERGKTALWSVFRKPAKEQSELFRLLLTLEGVNPEHTLGQLRDKVVDPEVEHPSFKWFVRDTSRWESEDFSLTRLGADAELCVLTRKISTLDSIVEAFGIHELVLVPVPQRGGAVEQRPYLLIRNVKGSKAGVQGLVAKVLDVWKDREYDGVFIEVPKVYKPLQRDEAGGIGGCFDSHTDYALLRTFDPDALESLLEMSKYLEIAKTRDEPLINIDFSLFHHTPLQVYPQCEEYFDTDPEWVKQAKERDEQKYFTLVSGIKESRPDNPKFERMFKLKQNEFVKNYESIAKKPSKPWWKFW